MRSPRDRTRRTLPALGLLVLSLIHTPTIAQAAWPNSPYVNLPVCTAGGAQTAVAITPDGHGGAILAWADSRGASSDIYARRVLASGSVDPAWPANGLALCTASGNQILPQIVADGTGGAIVTWADSRGAASDVYAQHVLGSGVVDPAWPANGRAICTATGAQTTPHLVADGAGGAIVTWTDARSGTNTDVYAQRVLASGTVDAAWPANGRALCTLTSNQETPAIATDGLGGAFVVWTDFRLSTSEIYAQHVLSSGVVDPVWTVDGFRLVIILSNVQSNPVVIPDGQGGLIAGWEGDTGPAYVLRVLANGTRAPGWYPLGVMLPGGLLQNRLAMVSDGAGGVVVVYSDFVSGVSDVRATHLLATGEYDVAWPTSGRAVCTATGNQTVSAAIPDGAGGALVVWQDERLVGWSGIDLYAQRVMASGAVDPAWPANGRALSGAPGDQSSAAVVADSEGGLITAWSDTRTGTADIHAQRVARHGYLGTPHAEMAGVRDVPNDEGGKVRVTWSASYLEFEPYAVPVAYYLFRQVPAAAAQGASASGGVLASAESPALEPGDLVTTSQGTQTIYWQFVDLVSGYMLPGYSFVASTTGDSIGAGNPPTLFMVQTRANSAVWNSPPDSGYSVDNLAPLAPAPFTGSYLAGRVALQWRANTEPDLAGYRLYRGSDPSFLPGPGNRIAELTETNWSLDADAGWTYKLAAVDVHGNESTAATLQPVGIADAGAGAPARPLSLAAPSPNPASGRAGLRFALPAGGSVRLRIYDPAGRLVRALLEGEMTAGEHVAAWDLRDSKGHRVPGGVYLVRLEAAGRSLVRRTVVSL